MRTAHVWDDLGPPHHPLIPMRLCLNLDCAYIAVQGRAMMRPVHLVDRADVVSASRRNTELSANTVHTQGKVSAVLRLSSYYVSFIRPRISCITGYFEGAEVILDVGLPRLQVS